MSDVNITNEQWNQHISDLISNHNLAFRQFKVRTWLNHPFYSGHVEIDDGEFFGFK